MKLDKRLLRLIEPSWLAFTLTIGLGLAGAVLVVVQARLLSSVLAQVFLNRASLAGVTSLLGGLLLVFLIRAGALLGGEVAGNHLAVRIKSALRARLLRRLQAAGPIHLKGDGAEREQRTGELVNTAIEGVEALDAYFSQYLPQIVLSALIPLTYLAFILPLDPLSAAILLLTAPLIPVFMIFIGDRAEELTKRRWQALSRMSAHFLDVLQGLTTLKILGRSRDQIGVIRQISERWRESNMGVLRVAFLSALALELIATLSTAIVAVEIGLRLLFGRLSFEQAFFVLLLAPEFYIPLRSLGTRFHAGMAGYQAAQRMFEILEVGEPAENRSCETTIDQKAFIGVKHSSSRPKMFLAPPGIRFEQVSFSYAGDREALREVSFQIAPGSQAALVGPSGSGKSTVAALLLGFVKPGSGEIAVDEIPLDSVPEEVWRRQVSWIPQTPYLFNDTVEANIRMGSVRGNRESRSGLTVDAVIQAAKLAYAHEFIQQLPQGYATKIGEGGARLSAGQAQRIALARAFLKDAPVLILDEATAHLDPESESLIQQALTRLAQGRTVLIIAHRLNTIFSAGQIIVLQDGRVHATGRHASLLNHSQLYRHLLSPNRINQAAPPIRSAPLPLSPTHPLSQSPEQRSPLPSPLSPSAQLPSTPAPLLPSSALRCRTPSPLLLLSLLAPFKTKILLAVLLGTATISSGIGLMATSAYIISAAALRPPIAALQVAIVGVRFFGLSRGVFRYLERYVSHDLTFRLLAKLRTWFYQALEPLAPAALIDRQSGDLLGRLTADIESLENFFVRAVAPPLTAILVTGIMAAWMINFHPSLAVVLWLFLVLAGIAIPTLVRQLGKGPGTGLVMARNRLKALLVDGIQGMPDLKVFGHEANIATEVDRLSQNLGTAQKKMAWIAGLQNAMLNFSANLTGWSILILAIPLVTSGKMDGVYLGVALLSAIASFEAISPLPAAAQYLESNLAAARRLFDLVDSQPEVREVANPVPIPGKFELQVQHIYFRYPSSPYPVSHNPFTGKNPLALRDISFSLPEGKHLAIVGPSGAGKSSFLQLLLRFWEYQEGEITLGGQDIRRLRSDALRHYMGVVPQKTHLFSGTIRENLLIARPEAEDAEIIRAAERAQIHNFIKTLPDGYDTWIGEQGLRLSAGQRQRLAIARALLKGAPLLVLDEPTAHLDPVTEQLILHTICQLMKKRTILLITHRLVSMDAMDEILVFDRGRICERGRHTGLIERNGLYRRMWDLQNQFLWEN